MKTILTTLTVLALTCATANAATFNFADANSNVITEDGITVTASSGIFSDDATTLTPGGSVVTTGNRGIGVLSDADGHTEIDGVDANDVVFLQFSQDVIFQSIRFGSMSSSETFVFFFDELVQNTLGDGLNAPTSSTHTFSDMYLGSLFGIGAESRFSKFFVKSVTAVSAVPLPAALPLYGAGVLLLGLLGWKRKKHTASE